MACNAPDFLANIEYIHFGRVRPMHVNAVLFGFVTPGLLAAAFYYFPKLLRTEPGMQDAPVVFFGRENYGAAMTFPKDKVFFYESEEADEVCNFLVEHPNTIPRNKLHYLLIEGGMFVVVTMARDFK